jgi:hypothetical protein
MADGGIYEWRPRAAAAPMLGDPAQPLAGRVLGQPVRTRDAEELRFYVLRVLTDRFAAAEGITVTKAEIDAFVASTAAALGRERAEAVARRDALKRELASGKLPAERKAQVEREIATAEHLIADLAPATGAAAAEERQAQAEIATAFIRQWKINATMRGTASTSRAAARNRRPSRRRHGSPAERRPFAMKNPWLMLPLLCTGLVLATTGGVGQ